MRATDYIYIEEQREQVQEYILTDLWFYTNLSYIAGDCSNYDRWILIMLALLMPSGINTLLSEYQYLNPLF